MRRPAGVPEPAPRIGRVPGGPSMARTFGRVLLSAAALLLVAGASAGRAAAEPPGPEPAWARAIRDGVASQDHEISRSSVGAVVVKLENAVGRNKDDVVSLYLLARAYGKKGAVKDAIQTYGDVIKMEPGLWFAWHDRGVLSYSAAKTDPATGKVTDPAEEKQAVADLERAVALKPDYVQALQDLAEIHLRAHPSRPGAAIPLLKQAIDADPGLDTARLQLAQALSAAGRHPEALDALRPMLSKQPHDPRVRMVQGAVTAAQGNVKEALDIFKQLSLDNPASPDPLREWLRVARTAPTFDPVQMVWVLERLRRLARTDKEKKDISEWILRIQTAAAKPPVPTGAPTAAQLAAILRGADAAKRDEVLQYLGSNAPDKPKVEGELVLALIERLDPVRETSPRNRILALLSFESAGTSSDEGIARNFGALIRFALRDPDPDVRAKTPDILETLGSRAAILALHPQATKTKADAGLAASARRAIYSLARAEPPLAEETPEAQAAAYEAWWASPERVPLKLDAIRATLEATDTAPEVVLLPLVFRETDPRVFGEAYKAVLRVADTLPADPTITPGQEELLRRKRIRDAWLKAVPRVPEALIRADRVREFRDALSEWYLRSPG